MDVLALEAKNANGAEPEKKPAPRPKPKPPKKARRIVYFEVEIVDLKTKEKLLLLDKVEPTATVLDIKALFHKSCNMRRIKSLSLLTDPQWHPARQSLRLDPKAKSLRDEDVLQTLPVGTTTSFYFSDLGPQVTWGTVFLTECAGPLIIYLMFYFRLPFIYAPKYDFTSSKHWVVQNIFKNCGYYWCSAAWMAYYINHPLYTTPYYGLQQVHTGLYIFLFCQVGNFSIHVALRNLKSSGSKTKKIPYPTKNPFTWIFWLVSCPNYTYELGSWIGFTVMTQCVPVAFFTLVAFIQMTVWAKGKHRSYLKEFRDYPTLRSSILPFIL
ncbi:Very-long-chain enoyl-CoA reductase [Channa argus]|uniref:Trans-2,3-enoyl-CoA reductase-like n=1 Tax=Channa argus TaxID=215402 RepID=A0A6G1QD73_CHAAH|nr:Very-long-chain enoyl-CoA reductase [Channa argus]